MNAAKLSRLPKWVDLSLVNLCLVASIGVILRTKIVFPLPFINYNHLLEAHSHFSFEGWATLVLMALFVHELLPESSARRPIYQWFLGTVASLAWCTLITVSVWGNNGVATAISLILVLITYLFGSILIRDLFRARLNSSIKLLAVSSIICLILSSAGVISMTYLVYSKYMDSILYSNALYTYLHFQYNGFFTLGIFALLFNLINQQTPLNAVKYTPVFSLVICISILPSLFLSYLGLDSNTLFQIIAVSGSLLLLLCFYLFLRSAISLKSIFSKEKPVIRFLLVISLGSFLLKVFLQSFIVFAVIRNAIFGNRPVIMGFLHLVFLAFVTLSLLTYLYKNNLLNGKLQITNIALLVFGIAVILNELLLGTQGLTVMFLAGSSLFSWLLWIVGILLFVGTFLLGTSRIRSKKLQ